MKRIFCVGFAVLLAACAPVSTPVPPVWTRTPSHSIPVSGMEASSTASPLPSKTKTTAARTRTPTPPPTSVACLDLTRPANGTSLSSTGNVEFAWESQPGAGLYVLSLISQDGLRQDSRTTATKSTLSIKSPSKSGSYYWSVSAYDVNGYFICNSGFISFTRGSGGTREEEAAAAAESSSTTYTFADLVNQGLIPPPEIPDLVVEVPPFEEFIDPDEFSSSAIAERDITAIVPPEAPATQAATVIVPPVAPATPTAEAPPAGPVPTDPAPTPLPPTNPPPTDPPPTDPPPAESPPAESPPTEPSILE